MTLKSRARFSYARQITLVLKVMLYIRLQRVYGHQMQPM